MILYSMAEYKKEEKNNFKSQNSSKTCNYPHRLKAEGILKKSQIEDTLWGRIMLEKKLKTIYG